MNDKNSGAGFSAQKFALLILLCALLSFVFGACTPKQQIRDATENSFLGKADIFSGYPIRQIVKEEDFPEDFVEWWQRMYKKDFQEFIEQWKEFSQKEDWQDFARQWEEFSQQEDWRDFSEQWRQFYKKDWQDFGKRWKELYRKKPSDKSVSL